MAPTATNTSLAPSKTPTSPLALPSGSIDATNTTLVLYSCNNGTSAPIPVNTHSVNTNKSLSNSSSVTAPTNSTPPVPTGWDHTKLADVNVMSTPWAGCQASTWFEGTNFIVKGISAFDHAIYGCSIDDEAPIWFNAWSPSPTPSTKVLCSGVGLSKGHHSLLITNGPMPLWRTSLASLEWSTISSNLSNATANLTRSLKSDNPVYDLPATLFAPSLASNVAWGRWERWYWILAVIAILEGIGLIAVHCGPWKWSCLKSSSSSGSKSSSSRSRSSSSKRRKESSSSDDSTSKTSSRTSSKSTTSKRSKK